ncbi:sensor histidine kinase [Chryseobacterium taichungense]|uniref:sensor histidine kinase n=1 Tax=Chryseobacterium taichungense TaxID=295069 RepID=UPI0028A7028D|nr:ATP-binding protein [Chryseobacterium taichungense]
MKYLWAFFFVLLFMRFSAQKENYYEKWYNADDSKLPQNTIKSIVKDKYGFLWLSTEDGIVRFDGSSFLVHDVGIPSVENRTLLIDGSADDDWLFTFYNSGKIPSLITKRKYSVINETNSPAFKDLVPHGAENLWKLTKEKSESIQKNRFYYYISKHEFYYLDNYRLFYHKDGKNHYIKEVNKYSFFRFFLLGDQLFYLKDSSVIEKIEKTGEIKEYATGIDNAKDFDYFINTANKQLLLKNNNNVYYIEYSNNNLTSKLIYSSKTMQDLGITCMYYDDSIRTVILGTFSKGFLLVRKKFIDAFKMPQKTVFHALENYGDGKVVTSDGDVFAPDGYIKTLPFPNKDQYGIVSLGHSEFLLKSEHGVVLWYNNKGQTIKSFGKESSVWSINKGNINEVWLSLTFKRKNWVCYFVIKDHKIVKEVYYITKFGVKGIARINSEELLLAANEGLYIFNEKKKIYRTLIANISFRSINTNGDRLFWIQSYGKGLYLYKDRSLYKPQKKKTILSSVHSVIDDGRGYYWLSSNKGLFQVEKQSFINSYLHNDVDFYIQKYNPNDGILTSEFNGGANINGVFNNGFVIFPSMNGMIYINTKKAFPVLPSENCYIDRIAINEKEKLTSGILNLKRNFGYIKIFVDYVNFGNQHNNYVDYKIDDNSWQKLPEDRIISINSLTSGEHFVQIRKLKNFSSDYNYKTLQIYVQSAFWETAVFKLLMVILVLLIFYSFYRIRLKQIAKESVILNAKIDERTAELKETINSLSKTREELYAQLSRQKKLVAAISHDIKSPLNFINISTGILLDNIDDEAYEKKVIDSINQSSAQILEFIDSTIRYNKIFIYDNYKTRESIMLRDFISQRIMLFRNSAEFKFIQIQNNIGVSDVLVSNPDVLSIVIHNILDNAVKYTHQGFIYIYATTNKNRYHLVIEDTGVGMSEDELSKLKENEMLSGSKLGMRIISELLPLINVSYDIESKKGIGTKVILTFNLNLN